MSLSIAPFCQNPHLNFLMPYFNNSLSPINLIGRVTYPWEDFLDKVDYVSHETWDSPTIFKSDEEYREVLECVWSTRLEIDLEYLDIMNKNDKAIHLTSLDCTLGLSKERDSHLSKNIELNSKKS